MPVSHTKPLVAATECYWVGQALGRGADSFNFVNAQGKPILPSSKPFFFFRSSPPLRTSPPPPSQQEQEKENDRTRATRRCRDTHALVVCCNALAVCAWSSVIFRRAGAAGGLQRLERAQRAQRRKLALPTASLGAVLCVPASRFRGWVTAKEM